MERRLPKALAPLPEVTPTIALPDILWRSCGSEYPCGPKIYRRRDLDEGKLRPARPQCV
jgi:hypothetical protein